MCMIAHRPVGPKGRGSNIPNVVIETALSRHPDGFGVAWRDDGDLRWDRFGPESGEDFRTLLKYLDLRRDVEYVAHWRMATHGEACAELAHPFEYQDPDPKVGTVLVFHNGVINGMDVPFVGKASDTSEFVSRILAELPSKWWDNPAIVTLVDDFTGWSKLVLMTREETVNLNFSQGTEDGGLWYSSNHKPETFATRTYKTTGYSSDYTPHYAAKGDYWSDADFMEDGWVKTANGAWQKADPTTTPRSNSELWRHEGHNLKPLREFDFTQSAETDGAYEDAIVCEACSTVGDVYVYDGKAYVDMNHKPEVAEEPEDDELLGPATKALTLVK